MEISKNILLLKSKTNLRNKRIKIRILKGKYLPTVSDDDIVSGAHVTITGQEASLAIR